MAKAVKKPRKKATGYQMPDPLPKNEILTDTAKKQWRLGASIGKGGFGEIYEAQEASTKSSKYPFVVKVEPHENGPLFVEMHFYMKNAKQSDTFARKHKLETFGMPAFWGAGSHEMGATKFRFIVMEKFGSDVDKLKREHQGALPPNLVFQWASQLVYVLEYMHELGYIHADIKGGNVLLGATPANKNQAYLIDFGLATKYSTEKVFKPNPKKAHDGTIEYLSRDAHLGVPTRRGDFEILAYNIIHWLGGTLPWEGQTDPKIVQELKEKHLEDVPKFVKSCLKKPQETVLKFLKYVTNLKFDEKPDYEKIRSMFDEVQNGEASTSKRRAKVEEGESVEMKPMRKRGKKQNDDKEEEKTEEILTPAMRAVLEKRKEKENKKPVKKVKENGVGDEAKGAKKNVQNGELKRVKKTGEVENDGMREVRKKSVESVENEEMKEVRKKVAKKTVDGSVDNEAIKEVKKSAKKVQGSVDNEAITEIKNKIAENGGRPKRNVPVHCYDEKSPKVKKTK